MNELSRHGEIMSVLGRLEAKVDYTNGSVLRHEGILKDHADALNELQGFRSRIKGGVTLATAVLAILSVLAGFVAGWLRIP